METSLINRLLHPLPSSTTMGTRQSQTTTILAASAAALAAAALYNTYRARQVERKHPPVGRFVEVAGTRLHYLEQGKGPPVVLLHGNVVSADDWISSGVLDRVARHHRVIAFDRPGFGYSERPRGSAWTAASQAELIRQALVRIGVERAVLVGHSWGTSVALALALAMPVAVRGLVLISGYYHPTLRADSLLVAPAAVPFIGDILRYTLSPLLGRPLLPMVIKGMFAPLPVPERFSRGFVPGMPLRPWQVRAEAQDGSTMAYGAASMESGYRNLGMPVALMAGGKDRVVDVGRHTLRLHEELPHSSLHLIQRAGHMVHYAVPDQVADLVAAVSANPAPASRAGADAGEIGAERLCA